MSEGPALALNLKKHHGISSTIYELQPKYDVRGVNITLAPNAVRVLQHVGVYDELRKHGYTYEDLNLSMPNPRVHGAIVLKALLDEAAAQGIPVIFGKKLVGLREDNDAVELEFADGTTTKASFVVGADGVHSRVRDAIMHTNTGYSGFMGIIGMDIKRESLHESINKIALPNFVFGKKGFVALMPSSYDGTVVDFFSTMPYTTQSREEWNKLAKHKTEVQKILQGRFGNEWPQSICDITRDLDKEGLILIPFYEVPPLDRWTSVQQRVILTGDSAHAFTPQGGQGAAMGLEDAETLSHTFSHPQFASDYERLLTIWQNHRKDRLILVKNLTDLSGRLRTPDSALVQFAKEWVMWANMKWTGPMGNMQWLNGYNAEDVLKLY